MDEGKRFLFTSESVTEGHPDKMADQISDAILDDLLRQDPESRVAVETLLTTGLAFVAGEVTTKGYADVQNIVRDTVKDIGYTDARMGFDYETCGVITAIHEQAPDIAMGVDADKGRHLDQGAGDQGLMFGYATSETKEMLPLTLMLTHKITMRLAEVRKKKILPYLRPDGKSQVTVEYIDETPQKVTSVVVAAQHEEHVDYEILREDIIHHVVEPVIPKEWITEDTCYYINETGRFVMGGPSADTGLTGRKIIVDTYGGVGSHGGGCFSGKDPSKVDRSASYMARYIAKNIVGAGLAQRVEVQVAYAIGYPEPVSFMVDTLGTGTVSEEVIEKAVKKHFDLRPRAIIERLDLLRPIYRKTAAYGHFGRNDPDFTWEKLDMVDVLKDECGV